MACTSKAGRQSAKGVACRAESCQSARPKSNGARAGRRGTQVFKKASKSALIWSLLTVHMPWEKPG
jgi:hypothetical protein